VLHHLPDPAEGLRALLSVLALGGGLGLMVYAPHGRTGVYMLQDALRLLAPAHEPTAPRLDVAKRVMRHLPETAWLRRNGFLDDHVNGGDAGLYDLLLNPRDRAFTVRELHSLLAREGLAVACWVEPVRYDPVPMLPDPRLRARVAALDPVQRAALAEALAGNVSAHIVYCVRQNEQRQRADFMADSAVPVTREGPGEALANAVQPDGTIAFMIDGLRLPIALPPLAPAILRLVDGQRSVGTIASVLAERGTGAEAFRRAWGSTFLALEHINRLLLAPPAD
jgi:hypothetical protein